MTPAMEFLDDQRIGYAVMRYEPSADGAIGIGAAAKLGLNPDQVLKTLIVVLDHNKLVVAIIPVSADLRLSALSKQARARNAAMAEPAKAERATGYVVGGISPFGQRRTLPTYLARQALDFERVFVSAGRRGLLLDVGVQDLQSACAAIICDITSTKPRSSHGRSLGLESE